MQVTETQKQQLIRGQIGIEALFGEAPKDPTARRAWTERAVAVAAQSLELTPEEMKSIGTRYGVTGNQEFLDQYGAKAYSAQNQKFSDAKMGTGNVEGNVGRYKKIREQLMDVTAGKRADILDTSIGGQSIQQQPTTIPAGANEADPSLGLSRGEGQMFGVGGKQFNLSTGVPEVKMDTPAVDTERAITDLKDWNDGNLTDEYMRMKYRDKLNTLERVRDIPKIGSILASKIAKLRQDIESVGPANQIPENTEAAPISSPAPVQEPASVQDNSSLYTKEDGSPVDTELDMSDPTTRRTYLESLQESILSDPMFLRSAQGQMLLKQSADELTKFSSMESSATGRPDISSDQAEKMVDEAVAAYDKLSEEEKAAQRNTGLRMVSENPELWKTMARSNPRDATRQIGQAMSSSSVRAAFADQDVENFQRKRDIDLEMKKKEEEELRALRAATARAKAEAIRKANMETDLEMQKVLGLEGIDPSTGKPYQASQFADGLYSFRMAKANAVIDKLSSEGYNPGSFKNYLLTREGTNAIRDPQQRAYAQAMRSFINATLRRESGAAIAASEFDSANKQYFAQMNDDPATEQQKRDARIQALSAFKASARGAYNLIKKQYETEVSGSQPQTKTVMYNGKMTTFVKNPETGKWVSQ
jgi:hypothetical protein